MDLKGNSVNVKGNIIPQDFSQCSLLKKSKSKKLFLCPVDSDSLNRYYLVKIYFYPGLQPLKYVLKRSKAKSEYTLAKEISKRGITTIVPEDTADIRKLGFLQKSIILTSQIPDCLNLEEFIFQIDDQDVILKRQIIQEYAKLVQLIHNQGIYQEDFAPYNILYQKKQNDEFQLYFLDLEKIRIGKELSFREKIRNLAKINREAKVLKKAKKLKNTDQIRFLKTYLGSGTEKEEFKEWIRKIEKEEQDIFLRDRQRAWEKSVSSSSRIGVLKSQGYRGFYRKRHIKQECYTQSDIIKILQAIENNILDEVTERQFSKDSLDITVDIKSRQETFKVRLFRYSGISSWLQRMMKNTPLLSAWKTDDLSLRDRTADFLPVAAVEKRVAPKQYLGFLIRKYYQ